MTILSDELHPVQIHRRLSRGRDVVSSHVTLRAYEVYCALFGEQPAMVDLKGRDCRGGFGVGELVAFLYARSFPKDEWRDRFKEAIRGMDFGP
ncbi:MAG TPA: hypothetical protein VH020_09385 [Stellaceae bacterium]|jgi:hypothetical protein|nr:hypothetical protein [Stellaceae bacterium]